MALSSQAPEIERLSRWPGLTEPGRFVIRCSCARWQFTGTAGQIREAARGHDDSPWRNHVVVIWGKALLADKAGAGGPATAN